MKKLYVGKLAYETTEQGLSEAFAKYGPVISARIIMDNMSGRSKGFGFVELEDEAQAEQAIRDLDGSTLDGRTIVVNEAQEKSSGGGNRGPRSSGGGRGGNHRGKGGSRGYGGSQRY